MLVSPDNLALKEEATYKQVRKNASQAVHMYTKTVALENLKSRRVFRVDSLLG